MIPARLGIAGVGLIGGSIALRARALGARVAGYDRDASALAAAQQRSALDVTAPDLGALARECDVLVIALPVDAACDALGALAGRPGPALVIDVASVKEPLARAGAAVANYLGTHPMAGSERSGIAAADAALFEGATWAHGPHPDAELVERTRRFIVAMGGRPLEIDAAAHDAVVALTSHLPQALAVALGAELAAGTLADPRVMELCGPGMMSMLRLARSPESVWEPIVAANAAPLAAQLRALAARLKEAAAALDVGESGILMSYFARARSAAVALEERIGPGPRSSAYPWPPSNPAPPPAR